MKEKDYDAIVLGSGMGGGAAVGLLRQAGASVAVVDPGPVGGTCALRGCQPKKVFVVNSQLVAETRALTGHGMARAAATDWSELQGFKKSFTDPIPDATKSYYDSAGVDLFEEDVRFVAPGSLETSSGDRITAGAILIATGASPRPLPVPGAELASTSADFLDLEELPESMVFVGGGYISMEFAFVAAHSGAKVTILQRGPRMLPQFPASLVDPVIEAGRDIGISFVTGASVTGIEKTAAGLSVTTEALGDFTGDFVMAAIGRTPNVEGLGLDEIGLRYSGAGIDVNEYMETSVEGVYAAGDCVASRQLSPVGGMESRVAGENMVNPRSSRVSYDAVPSVVFTYPRMASVGMTGDAAERAGMKVRISSGRMDEWASLRRLGSPPSWYEIVIEEESERILGAHIASPHAGDQVNMLAMAMRSGMSAGEIRRTPWAYPTALSDVKDML